MDDEPSSEEERVVSDKLVGAEAAERAGISLSTLRRWVALGLFPKQDVSQGWGPSAIAQARSLVKLRDRGYSIERA
jgi:DNA-binding transcriptional MerR regulator